jgi:hypothetical protein
VSSAGKQNDIAGKPQSASGLPHWLRTWRYFFGLLLIALLIGGFYSEENWRGARSWENYKRKLEAQGESFEPSHFIPPPGPDSENFAMTPLLAPIFQFIPGTHRWRDTNAVGRLQNFAPRYEAASRVFKPPKSARSNSWVTARVDLALWQAAFLVPTNRSKGSGDSLVATNFTVREAAEGILDALSDCRPVFEELREASQRKFSRFDIRYDDEDPAAILLPHLSGLKHFCEVLQLKASAELALERTGEAYNDINLMLYLADATRNEPILISHLVRFSELQLALRPIAEGMGQWSEPQLSAFQDRLRRFDFCGDIRWTMKAERALFGVGIIDYVRRSPDRLDSIAGGQPGPGVSGMLLNLVPSGWFYLEQVNYCRMFDDYMLPAIDPESRQIQPAITQKATADVTAELKHAGPGLFFRHRFFSVLMVPALAKVSQKAAFAQTAADLATLACALERYRLARGQFPETLDPLTSEFIEKVPHDIINGQPLKYRRTDDGKYVLYSVGWNEADDGGRLSPNLPGEGGAQAEGDWVWKPY